MWILGLQASRAGRDRRGVIFHNYAHLKYTNNSVTIRSLFKLFKTRILWFWHRWKRRIYFVLFHNSGIVRPLLKAAFQNKLCFFINDFEAWSVCLGSLQKKKCGFFPHLPEPSPGFPCGKAFLTFLWLSQVFSLISNNFYDNNIPFSSTWDLFSLMQLLQNAQKSQYPRFLLFSSHN